MLAGVSSGRRPWHGIPLFPLLISLLTPETTWATWGTRKGTHKQPTRRVLLGTDQRYGPCGGRKDTV